jgi:hypothetical protein
MGLNNWSITASYDTAHIAVSYEFAGLGFGSSTASRSIISRPRAAYSYAYRSTEDPAAAATPSARHRLETMSTFLLAENTLMTSCLSR